ncbi:MAG: hypothetical protein AMXMBFR33_02920 [Candidatus Xenobia bacterium]
MNPIQRGRLVASTLSLVLIVGLMLGAFQLGARYAVAQPKDETQAQVQRELGTFARLAKQLKPSVVNISVVKQRRFALENPFLDAEPSSGQGSGVIISPDGYVLTNNHVVAERGEVRVTLMDDTELKATLVGTDPNTDLALLKLSADRPLPAARLGDSKAMEVGDWVMAIGNPFGLEATVTVGVLSGTGRTIGASPYDDFLQTDAAINPGNSGGPLFNTAGEVVGINTAILPAGQGIGFAVPINLAREVVEQLKQQGKVVRGFVGIGIAPITAEVREKLSLAPDQRGALVASVIPGGPAEQAGAQVQDVVTGINGRAVDSDRDLLNQIAATPVGSTADLNVLRDGRQVTLKVSVAERPEQVRNRVRVRR